jgi:hypothetical protein
MVRVADPSDQTDKSALIRHLELSMGHTAFEFVPGERIRLHVCRCALKRRAAAPPHQ